MIVDVVIPVRGLCELTRSICAQLQAQHGWRACYVFDNGSLDDTAEYLAELARTDPRFVPIPAWGSGIYQMWEAGLDMAVASGTDYVAFLNNDLTLAPGTFVALASALDSAPEVVLAYPDYDLPLERDGNFRPPGPERLRRTTGTYRHGGMSGFAFMAKASRLDWRPLVEPGIHLWYGDDDLAFAVASRGGIQVRVVGLPIVHLGQATSNQHPSVFASITADKAAFVAKWGDR